MRRCCLLADCSHRLEVSPLFLTHASCVPPPPRTPLKEDISHHPAPTQGRRLEWKGLDRADPALASLPFTLHLKDWVTTPVLFSFSAGH